MTVLAFASRLFLLCIVHPVWGAAAKGDKKQTPLPTPGGGSEESVGSDKWWKHLGMAPNASEREMLDTLGWADDDPVEIYFAEFLLSRWVLDHAPWNAYHSALGFINNKTQAHVLFDYAPDDTTSVMKKLVPGVTEKSRWRSLLMGDVDVEWRNHGGMKFHASWPTSYDNVIRIGKTNGMAVNGFSSWVKNEFIPKRTTFDTLEVLLTNGSLVRSTMCHDFVTDSLWFFYDKGVKLRPKQPIFRDHIIMYAESIEEIKPEEKTMRNKREFLRYFRLLHVFYSRIAAQFTHGREALVITWKLGLPVYHRNKGKDYRVKIAPPFLNYCYLPLAIPPKIHNLMDPNKLCALSVAANISNITVPYEPLPAALSPEGRLDRDEVFIAFILVSLVATVLVKPSSD